MGTIPRFCLCLCLAFKRIVYICNCTDDIYKQKNHIKIINILTWKSKRSTRYTYTQVSKKKKKDKLQKLVFFHIIPQHYLIQIRSGECVARRCQYQKKNHYRHPIHLLGPSKQTHVYHRIILIKMKKKNKKKGLPVSCNVSTKSPELEIPTLASAANISSKSVRKSMKLASRE